MNLKLFAETIAAFRNGAPLGDVATMKLAAFENRSEKINEKLKAYTSKCSHINIDELSNYEDETLGKVYIDHLKKYKIKHLNISEETRLRFKDNPFVIRFTQTHDLHHVLTGFDTTLSGEAGVVAFMAGQGIGPVSLNGLRLLKYIYCLISPGQYREILHNISLGIRMGKNAKLVIAEPIEEMLNLPIIEVREKFKINSHYIDSVRAGKSSFFIKHFYKAVKK